MNRLKDLYVNFFKVYKVVKVKDLAEQFNCDVRTIQRDLQILEYNNKVKRIKSGTWALVE